MDNLTFKVALIQMCPEPLQIEKNFEYAASQICKAAAAGAALAVLPEYHLTGWMPQDPQFAIAAASADQYIKRYQSLACEYGIHLIPGTIVVATQVGSETSNLLNKSLFISATGDILGEYTKVNLWHPERDFLTSGPNFSALSAPQEMHGAMQGGDDPCHHPVISTPLGPVGLLICYDLAFPEAARSLVRAGARIVVIPTFTKSDDPSPEARSYNPDCEALFTQSALISRASENTCAIIFCNVGGPVEDGYMGLSQVVLPLIGTVPGSFTDSATGMRVVEINMKILDVAEDNYKIREDVAKDGFHYRHP